MPLLSGLIKMLNKFMKNDQPQPPKATRTTVKHPKTKVDRPFDTNTHSKTETTRRIK